MQEGVVEGAPARAPVQRIVGHALRCIDMPLHALGLRPVGLPILDLVPNDAVVSCLQEEGLGGLLPRLHGVLPFLLSGWKREVSGLVHVFEECNVVCTRAQLFQSPMHISNLN